MYPSTLVWHSGMYKSIVPERIAQHENSTHCPRDETPKINLNCHSTYVSCTGARHSPPCHDPCDPASSEQRLAMVTPDRCMHIPLRCLVQRWLRCLYVHNSTNCPKERAKVPRKPSASDGRTKHPFQAK